MVLGKVAVWDAGGLARLVLWLVHGAGGMHSACGSSECNRMRLDTLYTAAAMVLGRSTASGWL